MADEDAKALTEAEHILAMTQSQGWGIIKPKLDAYILDLQNISNIDSTSADTVVADIKARKLAVDYLFGWLKRDVYGVIEQQRAAQLPRAEDSVFVDRG